MGDEAAFALPRGASDGAVGRRMLVAALVVAVAAAAALSSFTAADRGGAQSPSAVSASFSPAQLANSRRLGAEDHRFWTVRSKGAIVATNPVQHLGASFRRQGVELTAPGVMVGISLIAVGRGRSISLLGDSTPVGHGNRITYRAPHLTQWYANGPLGLEQGLQVATPPMPDRSGALTFAYRLSSASRAELVAGQLVLFSSAGTPLMRYGGLIARDARGRALPSRLELDGSELRIRVDDGGARYPLSVDPLIQFGSLADFSRNIFTAGPAALALTSSTAVSLSIAAIDTAKKTWGTADEGVGHTLGAQVTITDPPGGASVTNVTPAAVGVVPSASLTAESGPTPAVPSGGYTMSPGTTQVFTVPYKVTAPGTVTLGDTVTWKAGGVTQGPASGQDVVDLGSAVTGHVYERSCSETSCSESGLEDATVVATGHATDGTAISAASDETDATGAYTIGVPAGTYEVGPSEDGATIDGSGFDPETANATVAATTALAGPNFAGCGLDTDSASSAGDRSAIAAVARSQAKAVAHASSAPAPTLCQSIYTLKISAKIPQPKLVDPSPQAHYEESGGGFNNSTGGLKALIHNSYVRTALNLAHEFPACLSDKKVEELSEHKATAQWYSYYEGGGSLGTVSVPIAWNQSLQNGTQQAHVAAAPVVTYKKITKVWEYRIDDRGEITRSSCQLAETVPVETLAVAGSDGSDAQLPNNEFTVLTTWGLPFDAPGLKVSPESTIVSNVLQHLGNYGTNILAGYNKLHPYAKFLLEFLISYAIGTAEVEVAIGASTRLLKFLGTSAKYFPGVVKGLEAVAPVVEFRHKVSSLLEARELVEYIAGALGEGEYPVMSAVVRGRFRTEAYLPVEYADHVKIPQKTQLALSVSTTHFPTISVSVSRDAYPSTASSGPSTGQPFTGQLPWATNPFSEPAVNNRTFGGNSPFVFADSTTTGHSYTIGKSAVQNVEHDTSQNSGVKADLQFGSLGPDGASFDRAQNDAPDPSCDNTNTPTSGSTICWLFNDQRP